MVEALKGKKNVIILERTDEALSGDNPLGRDIRTALSKAVQYEGHPAAEGLPAIAPSELPNIFSGSYGLGLARLPAGAHYRRIRICDRQAARAKTARRRRMA